MAVTLAAIYAETVIGFKQQETMVLIFVLNLAAAGGAFAWGYFQDRIGHKIALAITLVGWIATCVIAAITTTKGGFWWAAAIAGLCMGSSQSAGRAMAGMFAPRKQLAEFYGLWTFAIRLASIIGPLSYGAITWATGGNQRLAIMSTTAAFHRGAGVAGPGECAAGPRCGAACRCGLELPMTSCRTRSGIHGRANVDPADQARDDSRCAAAASAMPQPGVRQRSAGQQLHPALALGLQQAGCFQQALGLACHGLAGFDQRDAWARVSLQVRLGKRVVRAAQHQVSISPGTRSELTDGTDVLGAERIDLRACRPPRSPQPGHRRAAARTRPGPCSESCERGELGARSVPRVASTAMRPVRRQRDTAGLSAGSTPTSGSSGCSRRSRWMAAAVAVLQATTSALMRVLFEQLAGDGARALGDEGIVRRSP